MKLRISLLILILFLSFPQTIFSQDLEEERFYVAAKAFSDEFYEAAATLFKKFITEFPLSEKIYKAKLYLAKCYYFKEDYPLTLKIFNELAIQAQTKNFRDEVYWWLGETYFKVGNFKQSIEFAQSLIEHYPSSSFYWQSYLLAANSYLQSGQKQRAAAIFRKVIKECKEQEPIENSYSLLLNFYLQVNDYMQLVGLGEKYLEIYPQGRLGAKVYFYMAEALHAQKKWGQAIANYKKALKLSEDDKLNDLIYQGLGFTFLAKGEQEQAKKNIDKIENEENRQFCQGAYYFKIKEYSLALHTFNNFFKKFPNSNLIGNVYLNKADLLYAIGRINDALSAYSLCLSKFKHPEDAGLLDKAHYGLAWCYLKNGEFKKAIEEFKNTLKYTDNPVVKISSGIQIADAYQAQENYAKALETYDEILNNAPDTVYVDYVQFQRSSIFLKTKKYKEAIFILSSFKEKFPKSQLSSQAQYYSAVCYFSSKEYGQAKKLLKDFVQKFPQSELNGHAQYLYGKCFFNEGDYSQALKIFKEIEEKFKGSEIEEFALIDLAEIYSRQACLPDRQARLPDRQANIEQALRIYDKLIDSASSVSIAACLQKAFLLKEIENYPEAAVFFRKAIQAGMDSSRIRFSLAQCLEKNNQDKEAIDEYFNVMDKFGDEDWQVKAYFRLARIYEKHGDNNAAREIYKKIINFDVKEAKVAGLRLKELEVK
ncbi:MAG: tetratricopeptide repeat protein [Candidatus Omnitrophica bacterium]|nr:tetratricopeptide repeat protein [Candidatus Omnitrophota bacterium]